MRNLRSLRNDKKLSLRALGEAIGVAESTISLYETGKREANYKTMIAIADYFDVSLDCLLGRQHKSSAYCIGQTQNSSIAQGNNAKSENVSVILSPTIILISF
jgi:transcriptional regulator with XRE-family HTH domain